MKPNYNGMVEKYNDKYGAMFWLNVFSSKINSNNSPPTQALSAYEIIKTVFVRTHFWNQCNPNQCQNNTG